MANYNGSCTGAMLDKAGEMAMQFQSIELGRVELSTNRQQSKVSKMVSFKNAHINPRIFLQVTADESTLGEELPVVAKTSMISNSGFRITIDCHNVVSAHTYYADYMVVDQPDEEV